MKKFLAVAVLAACCMSSAFAAETTGTATNEAGSTASIAAAMARASERQAKAAEAAGLNDEQKAKLKDLQARRMEARKNNDREAMVKITEEVKALMTPEQYEAYRAAMRPSGRNRGTTETAAPTQ